MSGGRVKTVALSQNDLICVSTATRQKIVIFIVTSEMSLLVSKGGRKRLYFMKPFGSVVLPNIQKKLWPINSMAYK